MNIKIKTLTCWLLPLLFVAVAMSACVNTLELAAPRCVVQKGVTHEKAVATAKAYFDEHFGASTRSGEQTPTIDAPFAVGNLEPDWESGVTISNEEKSYTDFAMQKEYRFFLALEDEEKHIYGFELYSRLASVADFDLEDMSQYVATYIPDISFLSCYESFEKDNLLTCEHIDWFTGVILYTDLHGYHVAAAKYYDGELVDSSFLNDGQKTPEENVADFMRIMGGISLFVVPNAGEGTRSTIVVEDISGGQMIYWYDENGKLCRTFCNIDGITVTKPTLKPVTLIGNDFSSTVGINNSITTTISPIITGGGGGSSSSTTTAEEEEPTGEEFAEMIFENYDTLLDSVKQVLNDAMQKIIEDCMGKTLANGVKDKGMTFKYNTSDSSSNYDYANNDLIYNGDGADALLHEMVHAYQYNCLYQQYKNDCEEVFESAMANYEIEAQVARINYYKRNLDTSSNDWENQFYLGDDNPSLLLLSAGVDNKGNLKNGVTDKYLDLYIVVATLFESVLGYTYDTSKVLYYDNIVKLSENC